MNSNPTLEEKDNGGQREEQAKKSGEPQTGKGRGFKMEDPAPIGNRLRTMIKGRTGGARRELLRSNGKPP